MLHLLSEANTNSPGSPLRSKNYFLYEYESAYPFKETSTPYTKVEMIGNRHQELQNLSSIFLFF